MTKSAQHLSIFGLIVVMLALVGFGSVVSTAAPYQATQAAPAAPATGQAANLPATRPVIRVDANGTSMDGTPASYCWPSPSAPSQCDFAEDVEPKTPVSVTEGTSLTFQLDPASPPPQEFRATFTDDKAADGSPTRVDLLQNSGLYKVEGLSAGGHHVLVEAFYPGDSAESQYFVSSTFLLQVGSVAVAMATETGTSATESAAPVETAEATAPQAASPEPTSIVVTAEVVTAEAPTVEAPTVEAPTVAAPTEIAPTVVLPTAEGPTTEPAAVEVTAELPTEVAPTVAPTVIPPTEVPPTEVPPTLVPTPVPPTPEPPTPVPPTAIAAAPTAASGAPALVVIVAGRNYDPVAVNACVLSPDGAQTCVRRPSNAAAERIFSAPADTAQIAFKGPRPSTITASILSADAVTAISKQDLKADNLTLYTLPATAGNYVLSVDVTWPAGTATYYFRLTVNS